MVIRLCERQAAIAAVLHCKRNLHHLELSPQEWHNMEDIVNLLEPFKDATEVLSGQRYPTLSCLAPILRDKLAIKANDSNMLKIAKGAMMKDFDDRYLDTNVQLLMTKATFLDPRFKKFPHLSSSCASATLDKVPVSLKQEIIALLQQQQPKPGECGADNSDVQIVTTPETDSENPPVKKQKKIHPLRKLLGEDFGSSNATTDRSVDAIEDQAEAELARYKAEPQMPLEQNSLKW